MFHVVEFDEGDGGGVGIVRENWLTPKKKETFWPPEKQANIFQKHLIDGHQPAENWMLCKIRRTFYRTDDLLLAREKEKQALDESDVQTGEDIGYSNQKRRRRKPTRRLYSSSEDDSSCPFSESFKKKKLLQGHLPTPPETDNLYLQLNDSTVAIDENQNVHQGVAQNKEGIEMPKTPQVTAMPKTPRVTEIPTTPQVTEILKTPCQAGSPVFINEQIAGHGVIAKHLANIYATLKKIEEDQQIILHSLNFNGESSTTVETNLQIPDLTLPCTTKEHILKLENWISCSVENKSSLETFMVRRGGKTVKSLTHRILEKLVSNELAELCNWTGKYGKISVKNLNLTEVLHCAVRKNPCTSTATDLEIGTTISNWFRFSKDRNGGRQKRFSQCQQEGS